MSPEEQLALVGRMNDTLATMSAQVDSFERDARQLLAEQASEEAPRHNLPWHLTEVVPCLIIYRDRGKQVGRRDPDVIAVAERLGRTPASIAKRISNIAACDPANPNRGLLGHGTKSGRGVVSRAWEAFGAAPMDALRALDRETTQEAIEQMDQLAVEADANCVPRGPGDLPSGAIV